MKVVKVVVIIFLFNIKIIYADLGILLNLNLNELKEIDISNKTTIISNTNTLNSIASNKHQLFVEQSALAGFNFFKLNLETRLYYRTILYTNRAGWMWEDNKVDIGIENNFSLDSDIIGIFADIKPLSFFGVRINANFIAMFNFASGGYVGFDSKDDNYSPGELNSRTKENSIGIMAGIAPYFVFKFKSFTIINHTHINYIFLGDRNYYYDPRTAILHSQNEIEIFNDIFLLANINSFNIGMNHSLTYLVNVNKLSHRIGVATIFNFSWIENTLNLDLLVSGGLNIGIPNYSSLTYIEMKTELSYKIL